MHKNRLHGNHSSRCSWAGCNVPAVMATRTENRKDRIMTMLIAPFMSCSARLPACAYHFAFFPSTRDWCC
ncbi:MAG: hypothetical protein R2759_09430 [Bacteroidales bacterium]